jgi:glycogen operon protein
MDDGVNFCVFSKNCESMELLLFDDVDDVRPERVITLDPRKNKTFYYWHVFVPGIQEGQLYGYRAFGPFIPNRGLRFDGQKVLVDPYARSVMVGDNYDRDAAILSGDNCAHAMKSVSLNPTTYDWEHDIPLRLPFSNSVIYELHIGGFTRNPNSGVPPEKRGTYAGLVEKIPYLKDLGVTAVELLPVHQFDELDAHPPRRNYWGYSPVAFFSPHSGYSSNKDRLGPANEFRDMVKALHRAGIEIILDVVFNHTCEGDQHGPTVSFRGFENAAYYILEPDKAKYANFSGCGNTVNSNHSVVRRLIIDCLHYWVAEMHVDGFRFDLASVMSRDESGEPLEHPPIVWSIESDPVLAGTKIIAEAWDAAGLYQVGSFVGDRFAEWNGKFRDEIRSFVKGDRGNVGNLAARITGSPDLYNDPRRDPHRSINFITCHDGFTLNDLVSYNNKHNGANGEDNRDGTDENYSWNCGWEGPTDDPDVEALRLQQIKNFLTILFVSHGTPMLLMGDEVRRSKQGNNNTYCQDNTLSWFDWEAVDESKDLLGFTRNLIQLNRTHRIFREKRFWAAVDGDKEPRVVLHGPKLGKPHTDYNSHCLAIELRHPDDESNLYVIFNAFWKQLVFQLPPLPSGKYWSRLVDTSLPAPDDSVSPENAPPVDKDSYAAQARSSVILMTQRDQ